MSPRPTASLKSARSSNLSLTDAEKEQLADSFAKLTQQVSLTAEVLGPNVFEDKTRAREFLEDNIGMFMTCMTAAGASGIDLIRLIQQHHDVISANIKNQP